ncbi:uncharacterized protein LOC127712112 isoform X1 [Mytilus californianus]|uniref:uncharacterized protein LOC127712112 isoform X1 n=1 Tax=Mytilus californianus TaxID=6549 RepID=UPI0022461F8E|nr:uncharacterized protein LOC127712112 isoform X1 [Mytilus californianus]XP_052074301.1 uncharacterized protein LOC127712112 isoform X1 [Mytilus californianus]
MTAVSSTRDAFKTATSNISPNERSRTDGFDDIRPSQSITEEQNYHTYDLISTEIQDEPRVQGYLSYFSTFAGEKITDRYAGEKIKQHSRVVKTSWTPKADMQLGTIVKVKKSGKEVHVQWDKLEEKVNLLDLRLVDNAPTEKKEKSSRVVLTSRTTINNSTVSGMQVERKVNLRLLDNAPMEKMEQGARVVKKSWTPKEEMPLGTIVMVKKSRKEVNVQWDQIEEKVDLQDLRLASSFQCVNSEKKEGSRVVKVESTTKEESSLGTIIKVNKTKQTARVQWDKQPEEKVKLVKLRLVGNYLTDKIEKGSRVVKRSQTTREEIPFGTIVNINQFKNEVQVKWDKPEEKVDPLDLRLYDNAPSGVKHTNVTCDECYTYPLRGIRWKCLHCDSYDLCTVCYMVDEHNVNHIFSRIQSEDSKGKEISPRFDVNLTGYAFACGILENAEVSLRKDIRKRGVVLAIREDLIDVQWLTNNKRSRHNILELQCENAEARQFYPDHLPILGKDTLGHLDVDFSHNNITEKIQVNIRYRIEKEQKRSYKPVLYLIFANNQDIDHKKDRCLLMDEVFEYSKKTKLACHVIGKKVLFLHGSSRVVCIHHTTSNHTIKELVKKGFRIFERGDTNTKESEIKYFIRMAEYVLDEKVLPVIISLRNGGLNKDVLVSASSLLLPIIRFKKNSPDATVLTLENNGSIEQATEHITNLKTPWTVRKSETLIVIKNAETAEEISAINDVQSNLDFGALICHVVIGVSMANKHKVFETDKEVYANVLSMYLLKIEKWRIQEDAIKMAFDHRSIEYIYEKDLTTAFASGLRTDLEALSRLTYLPTDWKEKDIEQAVSNSDVIGLIFLTLLRKQFYSGATQLVDTGFVRISHILVGCKILQDASDDKKNEQIQRETSQRLKLYFTERATLITGFIYEANLNNDLVENELDEAVNHAGRLLVNHGYLEDAIRTQNKAFLENKIVTDILHKMWYGEEKFLFRQVGVFILLALIHLLVMPVLMINITAPPLKWFYQKYNLPFMKAFIQMLGYLALLVTYAYMLLFNPDENFSWTDGLIVGWMISFLFNEIKQAIVSALRHRFKRYMCNVWNLLDWAVMFVYASGMFLKFGDDGTYEDSTKILLVLTFILLSIRILNMFSISEYLGPKLVIIQKMFKDTFVFLIILTVIMMSYNVSYHSLLYPNSELSWKEIENVMQNGYWMLFGENGLIDSDTLDDCTDNKTIYTSSDHKERMARCPTHLGIHISPYLKALYGLIAVILLLNLLIAIYSDTYKKVNDECKFHWSQIQTDFLEEYSIETIFPIHLKLLMLPFGLIHVFIWLTEYCCFKKKDRRLNKIQHEDQHDSSNSYDSERDKLKENPMFVRVFLYNADYDLKLKSTEEAERIGAVRSKGKIEITDEDKITKLQNQIDVMNREFKDQYKRSDEKLQNQIDRKFKDQHKRNDEMLKMIKENMQINRENMKINHKNMKEIKSMIKAEFKSNTEQEGHPASTQL